MPGRYGKVCTCGLRGVTGEMMEAEVALLPGLPSFEIVGTGDSVVRESRNRIRAAVRVCGFDFPHNRIIASLAPAWVRKEGSAFDLPIALALLAAGGAVRRAQWDVCVFGELSLTGDVRPVPGGFSRALAGREHGVATLILPWDNYGECACIEGMRIIPVRRLADAVDFLNGDRIPDLPDERPCKCVEQGRAWPDLSSVSGQAFAKRALILAAAGWHNMLMLGSPGCGKSSLAAALPGILPALLPAEVWEVMRIHSAAGLLIGASGSVTGRPFRSPHHTSTRAAVLGGGNPPRPGEISLAHRGVLFLDELSGFSQEVLDGLRQPMEDRSIRITRLAHSLDFPADFLLLGASNPCRCGMLYEARGCRCTDEQVRTHMNRIGGPLLDRFDLRVPLTSVGVEGLTASVTPGRALESPDARAAVERCWSIQWARSAAHGEPPMWNGRVPADRLRDVCELDDAVCRFAAKISDRHLSARGFHRLLRVARTLADLEGEERVASRHVQEAFQYRVERWEGS